MKIKFLLVIVFIFLNVFPIKLQAQITIGSDISPSSGSLLDLKEYPSNPTTGVNATRGLGMPRVSLVDPNSLSPTSIDTDAEKTSHVGLLVYNVSNTVKICPGLHVWDGSAWVALKPLNDSLPIELRQPNSYIIAPGASINIPVSKAYAAWLNLTELGKIDLSSSSAVGGSTAISVELLWQTSNGVITSVALANGDQGINSSIRIVSGSVEGNGVVVLKIGGVVRWSWHIWVTNYDTTLPANQNTLGETVFMSRNLGAISDNIGSIGNRGLYYQWGRKDAFAGTNGINSTVLANIYNISGVVVTRPGTTTNNTLLTTVQNPLIMTTLGWLGSNASEPEKSWGYGCTELKSIYDPCPEGWRVPHNLVWNGIDANNFIWDGTNLGRQSTSTVGWYSAAGHISGSSAFNVGTNAAYWSSVGPGSYPTANVFSFSSTIVFSPISNFGPRSNASPVRCVKDWMM